MIIDAATHCYLCLYCHKHPANLLKNYVDFLVSLTLDGSGDRPETTRQERRRRSHSKNWESPRTRPAGDKPAPRGPHPHNAGSQSRPGLRTSGRSEPGYHSPRRPLLTGPQGCGFGRLCGRWALALRCRREQRSCFRLAPRAILQCRGGTDAISVAFGLPKAATTF